MKNLRIAALGAALTLGIALPASAQIVTSGADTRLERAELLTEYAGQLARLGQDYRTAASLLRDAAELRGGDRSTVETLMQAGRFNYYGGRPLVAVSAFKAAGETALSIGDRERAARAFHDAAWVASRAGEVPTARELLARSESLSSAVVATSEPQDR